MDRDLVMYTASVAAAAGCALKLVQRTTPRLPVAVLVGMRGAGKSSAGRAAARILGWDFVDMDVALEVTPNPQIAPAHGPLPPWRLLPLTRRSAPHCHLPKFLAINDGAALPTATGGVTWGLWVLHPHFCSAEARSISTCRVAGLAQGRVHPGPREAPRLAGVPPARARDAAADAGVTACRGPRETARGDGGRGGAADRLPVTVCDGESASCR